jgi:hypothetical protein
MIMFSGPRTAKKYYTKNKSDQTRQPGVSQASLKSQASPKPQAKAKAKGKFKKAKKAA